MPDKIVLILLEVVNVVTCETFFVSHRFIILKYETSLQSSSCFNLRTFCNR